MSNVDLEDVVAALIGVVTIGAIIITVTVILVVTLS